VPDAGGNGQEDSAGAPTCDLVVNIEAEDVRTEMYDNVRPRDSEGW